MASARDFYVHNGTLTTYVGSDLDVVIPEGIKEIGKRAFDDCIRISNVRLSRGLFHIGEYAFFNCARDLTLYVPRDSVGHDYAYKNHMDFEFI